MNETLINITPNLSWYAPTRGSGVQIVEVTTHAISPTEVFLALAGFVFLSYWYVKVTKNPDMYKEWMNPGGKVINLYKRVRIMFWVYTAMVILLGMIQIMLFRPTG